MRFAVVRTRNHNPQVRASWLNYPLLLDEVETNSMAGEMAYTEGLPLPWEWDQPVQVVQIPAREEVIW